MDVIVWEAKISLDIGLPDEVIPTFREECEKKFGITIGCYDYPADAVIDGQSIYSCKDAVRGGHHVVLTINNSQRKEFRDFFFLFCAKHNLDLSEQNLNVFGRGIY